MIKIPLRLKAILFQWPSEGDAFLRKIPDRGWIWEGNGGGHIAFPKDKINGSTLSSGVRRGLLVTQPEIVEGLIRGFIYWRTKACMDMKQDDKIRLTLRHHSVFDI